MQAPKTELCGLIRITDTLKKQVQHLISHHIRPNTPEAETYNSSIINRKQLLFYRFHNNIHHSFHEPDVVL